MKKETEMSKISFDKMATQARKHIVNNINYFTWIRSLGLDEYYCDKVHEYVTLMTRNVDTKIYSTVANNDNLNREDIDVLATLIKIEDITDKMNQQLYADDSAAVVKKSTLQVVH